MRGRKNISNASFRPRPTIHVYINISVLKVDYLGISFKSE